MFEVPDAKQVRREDLYGSASDDDESRDDRWDSAMRWKLNEQLSGVLDLHFSTDRNNERPQTVGANEEVGDEVDTEEAGQEFAFRLFRDEEPHKVVLQPQNGQTDGAGNGGFVVPKRPMSYYLAEELPPHIMKEFKMAAVSSDYLFEDAKKRRWGLEKPWKVTTISITTNRETGPKSSPVQNSTAEAGKRKRPGKKRRIILRVREKAKKEKEENAKHELIDKEQHLKDKKKRLNRQKKLKRRAKAREEKQKAPGDEGGSEQGSRDSSPDDSHEE
ncbi:hypothetical protein F5B20DRAFT_544604 [Whalleya microplaca]|nr:hypothetical protein F5B20DRAFT_544604 [Whalleya microplaca]